MCPVLYSGSTSRLVLNEANPLVALAGRCPALVLLFIQVPSRQSRKSRIHVDPLFSTWRTDLKTKSFSSIMASAVFPKAIFFFSSSFISSCLLSFLFRYFSVSRLYALSWFGRNVWPKCQGDEDVYPELCVSYIAIYFFFLPVYSLSVAVSVSIYLSVSVVYINYALEKRHQHSQTG